MNAALLTSTSPAHMPCDRQGSFITPWHICVHGVGLGESVYGPSDPGALTPTTQLMRALLQISESLLLRNAPDPLQALVHALLQLLLDDAHAEAAASQVQNALELLERIAHVEPRTSATGLALRVFTQVHATSAEHLIAVHLRATLRSALRCRTDAERQRYQMLSTAVQLLHAAQGALTQGPRQSMALQLAAHFQQALTAIRELRNPFDRTRLSAVLLASYGYGQWQHVQPALWVDATAQLLAEAADSTLPLPPHDAIHSGLDFVSFPLSLALQAAMCCNAGKSMALHRDAIDLAERLLQQLPAASQASQFAFLLPVLLRMQDMATERLQERWRSIASNYLLASDPHDADAYLRSTYLILAAASLGYSDALLCSLQQRVALALLPQQRPVSGYFSWPMVIAYALYLLPMRESAALTDAAALAQLVEQMLPRGPLPGAESRKLNYTLLHLALQIRAVRTNSSR